MARKLLAIISALIGGGLGVAVFGAASVVHAGFTQN